LKSNVKYLAIAVSTSLLLVSQETSACACCAERGYSSAGQVEPGSYPDRVFQEITFGPGAINDPGYEIQWDVSAITRSGEELVIQTDVGDLQFKPRRPYQLRATDISFITHPSPDDIPMSNVYFEMQLDGLLTLTSQAADQLGRAAVEATLLLQGRESACLEARNFQRWLLRAGSAPILLWGVGTLTAEDT
jgi:hypothetical protein